MRQKEKECLVIALTYSKQLLNAGTGRLIDVVATTSPGTTIHTVVATGTDNFEEVYVYCSNLATNDATLILEFGGTTTEEAVHHPIPARDGLYQIIPGVPLTATTSIVRARATATSILQISGWVNRAT